MDLPLYPCSLCENPQISPVLSSPCGEERRAGVKPCRTNQRPTESRWHHISLAGVWIPVGCSSGSFRPCLLWPPGSSGLPGEMTPSCPPVPRCWKLVTRHACWPFLSQNRSPKRSQSQLSRAPTQKDRHPFWALDTPITSSNQLYLGQFYVKRCTILRVSFGEFGQMCTGTYLLPQSDYRTFNYLFQKKSQTFLLFAFFIFSKYRSLK